MIEIDSSVPECCCGTLGCSLEFAYIDDIEVSPPLIQWPIGGPEKTMLLMYKITGINIVDTYNLYIYYRERNIGSQTWESIQSKAQSFTNSSLVLNEDGKYYLHYNIQPSAEGKELEVVSCEVLKEYPPDGNIYRDYTLIKWLYEGGSYGYYYFEDSIAQHKLGSIWNGGIGDALTDRGPQPSYRQNGTGGYRWDQIPDYKTLSITETQHTFTAAQRLQVSNDSGSFVFVVNFSNSMSATLTLANGTWGHSGHGVFDNNVLSVTDALITSIVRISGTISITVIVYSWAQSQLDCGLTTGGNQIDNTLYPAVTTEIYAHNVTHIIGYTYKMLQWGTNYNISVATNGTFVFYFSGGAFPITITSPVFFSSARWRFIFEYRLDSGNKEYRVTILQNGAQIWQSSWYGSVSVPSGFGNFANITLGDALFISPPIPIWGQSNKPYDYTVIHIKQWIGVYK